MMFWSKVRVLDTDDVKQRPLWSSLFSVEGKCAWYYFMVFVFNMSSVSGTRSKCQCFVSPCTVKLITCTS